MFIIFTESGAICWCCFFLSLHPEQVPPLWEDPLVEQERCHIRKYQDGDQRGQHASGLERPALHINTILQRAARETQDGGKVEHRLATQHSHHKGNNVTCHSPVGIGWSDEEDADQLGEHDGVGQVRAEDPEGQRSAVQVGEWGSYSPYDHYGEADHPLQLFLWYLNRTPKLIFPKISTQTFKNSAFWPTLFLPDA